MLEKRVITAVLGVLIVVLALAFGDLSWRVLVYIGTMWAVIEFCVLAHQRWYSMLSLATYAVVTYVMWMPLWHPSFVGVHFLIVVLALFLSVPVFLQNKVSVQQSAFVLVGALYIGLGGASLAGIGGVQSGRAWLLVYLLTIWSTDTVAYFVGRSVGGIKLLPAISPNKTVSGSIGGLLAAIVIPTIIGVLLISPSGWWEYVLVGVVGSVVGQIGDLIESAYKRTSGVKDSGHLLPGHGGMLDRVDALLFAAPLVLWIISSLHT